ncbi:baseplate J/gp47 family protein [Zhihengliuella halotolerans]|uniref:baseplate J/gp47 family protein n=1 Tax=Zhihengliuella halotolerans TaxID=370736 RepID=UPI000C80177B|nr:baseplate J/gp47 family protein [Zhihengliuella halotolerans]
MTFEPIESDPFGPIDVPEYEALDLLDYGGEADLFGAALARLELSIPEWEPRPGTTEMLLLESLSMMLGVEVLALQMAPAQVVEQLMGLYGVRRDPGRGAEGKALFTVTGSKPQHTIPLGTRLRYEMEETGESYDLLTTEARTIITTDGLTALIAVGAELVGTELNGLPDGTELQVVDQLPFIETVALDGDLTGGAGEEGDGSFYSRATATLSTLNSTLVLPEDFQYAARAIAGIGRARVLNLHDPSEPGVEKPGHVSVAVANNDGQVISAELRQDVEAALGLKMLASLTLHVIDPTYTNVDVSVTVQAAAGNAPADVQAVVDAAIRDWINPATWDWAPEVAQYALIALVGSLPQVAMVTMASDTVPLSGDAPLPTLGTVTIEVN